MNSLTERKQVFGYFLRHRLRYGITSFKIGNRLLSYTVTIPLLFNIDDETMDIMTKFFRYRDKYSSVYQNE